MPLAYLAAKTYGMETEAEEICRDAALPGHPPILPNASLLVPSFPILKKGSTSINWPRVERQEFVFEAVDSRIVVSAAESLIIDTAKAPKVVSPVAKKTPVSADAGGWDVEEEFVISPTSPTTDDIGGEGWDIDAESIDIPDSPERTINQSLAGVSYGTSAASFWMRNSQIPAHHIAAGSFEGAKQMLISQVGIADFSPLKSFFTEIYQASFAFLSANPGLPAIALPINQKGPNVLPENIFKLSDLNVQLKTAYQTVTSGK